MRYVLTQLAIYLLTVLNVVFLAGDIRLLHWIDFTLIFVLTLYAIYIQPKGELDQLDIALPFTNFMLLIVAGTVNTLVPFIKGNPDPSWLFSLIFLVIFGFMAERHYSMYKENVEESMQEP